MTRLSRRPSGSSQVISRSKGKHLLEFPSLIKAHDIHDKAQDMATIILQEEAATRAMIEKDQEQPQSSRGGRPPKNAKGGGGSPWPSLMAKPLMPYMFGNLLSDLLVRRTRPREP